MILSHTQKKVLIRKHIRKILEKMGNHFFFFFEKEKVIT